MIIFKQLNIIFAFYLCGEGIALLLPFSFPGGLIGLVLLYIALILKWLKLDDVKLVSDFFIKYMAFFFIPAGVSILNSYALIEKTIIPISALLIFSTVIVMVITGLVVDFFVKRVKHD
ncbi:MAG: CidA/LrgA family protein [Gammaproteobacteria bacterium]|nr:CidA/LrgA family protein [Gammaproteobacteria bacterium]